MAKYIIRPPRLEYSLNEIPANVEIRNFGEVERVSIAFQNDRNNTMFGSFYSAPNPLTIKSCVVYMHGNASNQGEGRFLIPFFIPSGISVFCFDFDGCGCSTGKYVSLGHYESQDMDKIINILTNDFQIQQILLWGRSMGAAVALMIADKYQLIKGIVADSPFCSIKSLIKQLGKKKNVPKWFTNTSIHTVRDSIQKKANFDIYDVDIEKNIGQMTKPVLFLHGEDDDFVDVSNSLTLHNKCSSQLKNIILFPGKHNSDRPPEAMMTAAEFLCRAINLVVEFRRPDQPAEATAAEAATVAEGGQNSNQHFENLQSMINSM